MNGRIKRLAAALLSVCIGASLLAGCARSPGTKGSDQNGTAELQRYEKTYYEYFDTLTTVIGYAQSQEDFDATCQQIQEQLVDYNQRYDIYNSYDGVNNIRTINENAGQPVEVDDAILDLLEFSKEAYTLTQGMTNVAMGSVLSIWHDFREAGIEDPDAAALPDMKDLQAAAKHCDLNAVVIDRDKGTVCLTDPEMSLDVGAVAKGFATERIAQAMQTQGLDHYILNVGGNIRAIGGKLDGEDWATGIQNPDTESQTQYLHVIGLRDMALVTSGNYQRYYEVDGVRYHHIISPETLMPKNEFSSVTILAADSGLADALSTACFNLSLEKGQALIESLDGVEALWIAADGTEYYSSGMEARLQV